MARVLLVDGNWVLHRAFFVVGMRKEFSKIERSVPSLFLSMVLKDASRLRASHIAVVFDAPESFRFKIYPRYKEKRRKATVEDMLKAKGISYQDIPDISPYSFLSSVRKLLALSGILSIQIPKMEADDALAAGAVKLARKKVVSKIYIETHDKDLMQVVNKKIILYWPAQGKKEERFIDISGVMKEKGCLPEQMRDLLTMTGDSVDSIPGSLSEAKALKILFDYGSIKRCFETRNAASQRLRRDINKLYLARKLVTLKTDCWEPRLKDLALGKPQEGRIVNMLGYYPKRLNELHAESKISKMRGLFG